MAAVVALVRDLLFGSRVQADLVNAGHEVTLRADPESARAAAPQADVLVVALVDDEIVGIGLGEGLRAGEIIITGSVVPPLIIEPDETELVFALDPVGSVSVRFTH